MQIQYIQKKYNRTPARRKKNVWPNFHACHINTRPMVGYGFLNVAFICLASGFSFSPRLYKYADRIFTQIKVIKGTRYVTPFYFNLMYRNSGKGEHKPQHKKKYHFYSQGICIFRNKSIIRLKNNERKSMLYFMFNDTVVVVVAATFCIHFYYFAEMFNAC